MKQKQKYFTTKIIGGKYKGKSFFIPDIHTTRSSKNVLRESLFNTLQFEIVDKPFVEVFSGSGSVGFEALSRGASKCYFIEKNTLAYECLTHNAKNFSEAHEVLKGDSFTLLPTLLQRIEQKTYFYFDPPFSIRDGMEEIYDKTLALIGTIKPEQCEMIIVEHMTNVDLPHTIGAFNLMKQKRFGKSTLSYYTQKEDNE